MLSHEDNETLVRVGPGTPMGEFHRLYWIPFLLSKDLVADGQPKRVRLLGEDLVAFRASDNAVGLVDNACAHRGAPLIYARNEECGLRCVYHGWKFDVSGQVTDMPAEPAHSRFKDKLRIKAYPCRERNGVVWTVLASGHLASFDRRKCKGPLNGPAATGQQCPEGWTLSAVPGPSFQGMASVPVDSNYYDWVDQFDTFGLGKNVPIATGNGSDALMALPSGSGKFVVLRVPYPMGFYAKSMDGRIDDPKAGWKGKGLWSTYATRTPQHLEGGKGTTSKAVKFQLRPDPLAK